MSRTILFVCLAAVGCAGGGVPAGGSADRPVAATATPAAPTSRADFTRPGDPPPKYKPSSSSANTVPITIDAYGAYGDAPDAPHLGDKAEDFELPLADGGTYKLSEARAAGPVLVMFYRGFW